MPVVTVEVDVLAAAARSMVRTVADPLTGLLESAACDVLLGDGMAGDDPAATQWSTGYDRTAPVALHAGQDVVNSCYRVASMLGATAHNYASAEAASTLPGHSIAPDLTDAVATLPEQHRIELPTGVPSARGGGSGEPPGWHFIAHHLGGYVWPNGHQDRLRAAATAWRASARALEGHATDAAWVDLGPLCSNLPEGPDISTVCNTLCDQLHAVARAHRGLAAACSQLAAHIDHARSRVEHELGELLAWTAGIQTIGGIASVFSLGAAEAPTQAGQAARIAATAAEVAAILKDFAAAVHDVLEQIGPIADAVADVRTAVAWLTDLRIVEVEVTAVPGLRVYQIARIERTGNAAAAGTRAATGQEAALENLASEASTAGTGRARWTSERKLREHFAKHRKDFDYANPDEYADGAAAFYDRANAEGLPMKVDKRGDVLVYDQKANIFGVFTKEGRTKTMFKPDDGVDYWNRQRGRAK